MNSAQIRGVEGALGDVLTGILGRLRGRHPGPCRGGLDEDPARKGDGFVHKLEGHLRYAEDAVFPILRKGGPGSDGDIEELEKDHRLLCLCACDLAVYIKDNDGKRASEVARSFLAVLLDHARREPCCVARGANDLNVSHPRTAPSPDRLLPSPLKATFAVNGPRGSLDSIRGDGPCLSAS